MIAIGASILCTVLATIKALLLLISTFADTSAAPTDNEVKFGVTSAGNNSKVSRSITSLIIPTRSLTIVASVPVAGFAVTGCPALVPCTTSLTIVCKSVYAATVAVSSSVLPNCPAVPTK